MKLCNLVINGQIHLGIVGACGIIDATASGIDLTMDQIIACTDHANDSNVLSTLKALEDCTTLPVVTIPCFANIVSHPDKLLCVGLNYKAHADGVNMGVFTSPVLFSKYSDALAPSDTEIELPLWETSYDYEAELVIVIGKTAWNVTEEEAGSFIFGYTCGNDISCRDPQKRTSQWLIGKTMPGFGPCGPFITTADELDPERGLSVRSFVNGELRQDGTTSDMIFNCCQIVSYASRYIRLNPGDLIFTGTPSGVALEERRDKRRWLEKGDRVDIEIEGIGTLTNTFI